MKMKFFLILFFFVFVNASSGINAQESSPTSIPASLTPVPSTIPTEKPTPTLNIVRYGGYCTGGCITATPSPRKQYVPPPTSTLIPTLAYKPTNTPVVIKKQIKPTSTNTPSPIINPTNIPTNTPTQTETVENQKITFWERMKQLWSGLISRLTNKSDNPDVIISTPTPTLTPTPTQPENTPTPTSIPTNKPKPKPTAINKPISVVDENILRTKFGISSPDLIASILIDSGKLERYEREYYNQIKGWPELNTTAIEQRIFIPSLNSTKICKTANIIEIKNACINVSNQQAKQIDLKQKNLTGDEAEKLSKAIEEYGKNLSAAKYTLNELVGKYCRGI